MHINGWAAIKAVRIVMIFILIIIGQFTYAQHPEIKKGLYLLINTRTGKAVGMENDNTIVEQDIANEITREWLIELLADGSYKFTNQEGGKVLQVKNESKKPYAIINQDNWRGSNSQKWYIKFSTNGHLLLQNKKSGYYLSIYRKAMAAKYIIQQTPYFKSSYQEWRLKRVVQ
jgi:hypothetical protein